MRQHILIAAILAALIALAVAPASADLQIRVFIIPNWGGGYSPCGGYYAPPTWSPPPCGGYGNYGYQPAPAPSYGGGRLTGYSNTVNYDRPSGRFVESGSARYGYPDGSTRRQSWDNVPTLPYQSPW